MHKYLSLSIRGIFYLFFVYPINKTTLPTLSASEGCLSGGHIEAVGFLLTGKCLFSFEFQGLKAVEFGFSFVVRLGIFLPSCKHPSHASPASYLCRAFEKGKTHLNPP